MQPIYMLVPTLDTWIQSEQLFKDRWQFPNCVGAVDCKHCNLICPPRTGSWYRNYKHSFSIVLLAVVDAAYKFTWVDIGRSGGNSDAGLFRKTALGQKVLDGSISFPPNKVLPGMTREMPHVLVGDEAFPLLTNLLCPYSGRTKPLTSHGTGVP